MNTKGETQPRLILKVDEEGIWLEFIRANGDAIVLRAEDLVVETQPTANALLREWCRELKLELPLVNGALVSLFAAP